MHRSPTLCALLATTFLGAADAVPAPKPAVTLALPIHAPSNLYWRDGAPLAFASTVAAKTEVSADLTFSVLDYPRHEALHLTRTVAVTPGAATPVAWDLGALPDGYYTATLSTGDGASVSASFGVAPHTVRSAADALAAGSRIGLKMFYMGPASWAGNVDWDERAAVEATTGLGLQWTRALLQEGPSQLSTVELVTKFPMNAVLKVERFPAELYDSERYGPMAEWEAKNGKGAWTLKTLPKKEPYQAWLREQVAKIPREQKVFEVWNEAWDKLSPEDLATLCTWIGEVIRAERPDAHIGPNLLGNTSRYAYDAKVIAAGGMKLMDMVCLHPYGSSENRAWLREYKQWLKEQTGRDIPIYVTEYGAHSTPEGPAKQSEEQQARAVVTQTLNLYAEGVVAMTPHWMGQREQNRTYLEDWFGFYRLNQQPKPCLLALATCARLIDGSRYVGDLWYGPGVGAMLFESKGTYTLALYTKEGSRSLTIDGAGTGVQLIDQVGTPRQLAAGEKLTIEAGIDVQYLVGLPAAFAAQASTELHPGQWPDPKAATARATRSMPHLATPPVIDGQLNEWQDRLQIALINEKVAGDDASALAGAAWDEQNLYLALNARDNQILNTRPEPKMYQQDSLEIFISTEVRDSDPGYGPHDHQFIITPTTAAGTPFFGEVVERSAGTHAPVAGAHFAVISKKPGWNAEIAIPWSALKMAPPSVGTTLALDLRLNDADNSHERWKVDPLDSRIDTENPTRWAVLTCAAAAR